MIEEYIKFELQGALNEAKKVAETLPITSNPYGYGEKEDQLKAFLDVQIRNVLLSKVEAEVRSKFSFYSIEQLCYLLEKLHEEPKTKTIQDGAVAVNFKGGVGFGTEVQPRPALQSPTQQKPIKGGKKPILKRV